MATTDAPQKRPALSGDQPPSKRPALTGVKSNERAVIRNTTNVVRPEQLKSPFDCSEIVNKFVEKVSISDNANVAHELELKFGTWLTAPQRLGQADLENVAKVLKANGFVAKPPLELLRLAIAPTNKDTPTRVVKRLELVNMPIIKAVCNEQTLPQDLWSSPFINYMVKKTNKEFTLKLNEWNATMDLSEEDQSSAVSREILDKFNKLLAQRDSSLMVSNMNRVSYVHKDLMLRVDLSVVRSKAGINDISQVMSGPVTYEIEAEAVLPPRDQLKLDTLSQTLQLQFNRITRLILSGLQDTMYPMSYKKMEEVMFNYLTMVGKLPLPTPTVWNSDPKLDRGQQHVNAFHTTSNFVGPDAMTLEAKNWNTVFDGKIPYMVTPKADGERRLLFIDRTSSTECKLYFITPKVRTLYDAKTNRTYQGNVLVVQFTGLSVPEVLKSLDQSALLDGEYVANNKDKLPCFYAFDCYVSMKKGQDYVNLHNQRLPARLNQMNSIIDELMKPGVLQQASMQGKLTLVAKRFFDPLQTEGQTWQQLLQTVFQQKLTYDTDGLIFTPKELGVSAMPTDKQPNRPLADLERRRWPLLFKWKPDNTIDFQVLVLTEQDDLVRFKLGVAKDSKTIVPFKDDKGEEVIVEYGRPLHTQPQNQEAPQKFGNKDIVEFKFDQTEKKWLPIRVRREKKRPNAIDVAESNWAATIHPITESMLTGNAEPVFSTEAEGHAMEVETYYPTVAPAQTARSVAAAQKVRSSKASLQIADFNNQVKRLLIKTAVVLSNNPQNASLIDLAVGQGGDIFKWRDNHVKYVLAVDKFRHQEFDNRMSNQPNIVYDYLAPQSPAEPLEPKLSDQAREHWGGFDVASMQFALHFMFENEATLDGFLRNVSNALSASGHGYFIGTCFDGRRVFDLLSKNPRIELKKDQQVVMSIDKMYAATEFVGDMLGQPIDVVVETINYGKPIQEYLVNFDYLRQKLADFGFQPVSPQELLDAGFPVSESWGSFEKLYRDVVQQNPKFTLTADEQQFAFLNNYFIFKKASGDITGQVAGSVLELSKAKKVKKVVAIAPGLKVHQAASSSEPGQPKKTELGTPRKAKGKKLTLKLSNLALENA